jgi:hypothetical protein
MDLNKYLVDANTVGDWDDNNQLAADNLNRIYQTLHLRIGPVLIVGKERLWDPELYDEIMSQVRDDWMNRDKLLNLTDEQIDKYVESLAEIYGIPPISPPKVDNVEIKKETEVEK